MNKQKKSLEEATVEEEKRLSKRGKIADFLSGITYSLVVGSLLDYSAGLRFPGIMYSRASSLVTDSLTSAPYGMWRDKVFKTAKTTEKSGKIKKYLTDLVAFNTFPVAIPEKVRLLTAGDAVKFTVGKLPVPPVVIFDPGCTLVTSFVSEFIGAKIYDKSVLPEYNVVAETVVALK